MKKNAAEVALDPSDTVTDFDPWAKALEMLSSFGDSMKGITKDIKSIKQELRSLNTNLDLVRQAQINSTTRITLLEAQCPKRNGTCPADLTPPPHAYVEDCSDSNS